MSEKRGTLRINWCFTINNYSDNHETILKDMVPAVARYIVFGREVGETGTPHLQGYVQFINKKRLTQIKKMAGFETAHLEPMMARDPRQAAEYCKKDKIFTEAGVMDTQGQRKDLLQLAESYRLKRSYTDLKDQSAWYQYQRMIVNQVNMEDNEAHFFAQKDKLKDFKLKNWQAVLVKAFMETPCSRSVYWLYDTVGNTGKSWFSRWLVLFMKAIRFENGKNADIKYAYNGERVVVFDYARTIEGRVNYEAIESIKNGIYFNTKYASGMRVYGHPHLLCLANFPPDTTKLSEDRWIIMNPDHVHEAWDQQTASETIQREISAYIAQVSVLFPCTLIG